MDLRTELDLSGFSADQVPLIGGVWRRPPACVIESTEDGEVLRWDGRTTEAVGRAGPDPALAQSFARLADASTLRIRKFGERYGPLDLCAHGLPRTHLPRRLWRYCKEEEVEGHRSIDERLRPVVAESVDTWRTIANSAAAVLRLAAAVQSDDGIKKDQTWDGLTWLLPDITPVNGWRFGHYSGSAAQQFGNGQVTKATPGGFRPGRARIEAHQTLAYAIGRWLELADVKFSITYRDDETKLELLAGSLFGAVGVQLALLASGSRAWEICSNCGKAFVPRKKRTPAGRRSYCDDEACRRAVSRDAKRDQRRRAVRHGSDTGFPGDISSYRKPPLTWSPDRESNPGPFHYE